jgi:alanine racemase
MPSSSAPQPPYRAWAEIDLGALERNVKKVRAMIPPNMRYIAVVKADAYGHGYRQTATRLMQNGVDGFAVANVKEGEAIREVGGGWPIIILSPVLPFEREAVAQLGLIPAISNPEELSAYAALGRKMGKPLTIQLKIDTGMGRNGVWYTDAPELAQKIATTKGLLLGGIMTHFSCADCSEQYTITQRKRFVAAIKKMPWLDRDKVLIHADNSAGLLTMPQTGPFNGVRVGLLQFGILPVKTPGAPPVEPVLSFHSRICSIKNLPKGTPLSYNATYNLRHKSRVGILSAGYADGIPTQLSNRGEVLIRGHRAPILGRVTMDMTLIDLTEIPEAQIEDPVVIIGRDGTENIPLRQFCAWADTIPWEASTSITGRVPRVYKMGLGF